MTAIDLAAALAKHIYEMREAYKAGNFDGDYKAGHLVACNEMLRTCNTIHEFLTQSSPPPVRQVVKS